MEDEDGPHPTCTINLPSRQTVINAILFSFLIMGAKLFLVSGWCLLGVLHSFSAQCYYVLSQVRMCVEREGGKVGRRQIHFLHLFYFLPVKS